MPTKCCWVIHGHRESDQRTQSFHFPIVIHQSLDPAAQSSAQAPSSLSSHALRSSSTQQPQNTSTRMHIGSTRRRGNHMHDHSRFQHDINDITGVSLSLSLYYYYYYSQKSLTHNMKRFRASYNEEKELRETIAELFFFFRKKGS